MRLTTTFIVTALLAAAPATVAAELPTDAQLLGAKTVGVLPVLTSGPSRAQAYARLRVLAARGVEAKAGGDGAALVRLEADATGLAFAGASTANDVRILHFAFIAGGLASNLANTELFGQAVAFLEALREALAPLRPEVVAAMDRFVAAAKRGEVDVESLLAALSAAEEGIASGPPRAHGYFATGVWLGLTFSVAATREPDPEFGAMATPLATLLEEDAEFGGSDRALAKEVRALGLLLSKPGFDNAAIKRHLSAALAVQADVPAAE